MLATADLMAVVMAATMMIITTSMVTATAPSPLSHHNYRYEAAREYTIDLDMEPQDRWNHVAADFQGTAMGVNGISVAMKKRRKKTQARRMDGWMDGWMMG